MLTDIRRAIITAGVELRTSSGGGADYRRPIASNALQALRM